MVGDDLPVYPTPQQAVALGSGNDPLMSQLASYHQQNRQNVGYKPAQQYKHNYSHHQPVQQRPPEGYHMNMSSYHPPLQMRAPVNPQTTTSMTPQMSMPMAAGTNSHYKPMPVYKTGMNPHYKTMPVYEGPAMSMPNGGDEYATVPRQKYAPRREVSSPPAPPQQYHHGFPNEMQPHDPAPIYSQQPYYQMPPRYSSIVPRHTAYPYETVEQHEMRNTSSSAQPRHHTGPSKKPPVKDNDGRNFTRKPVDPISQDMAGELLLPAPDSSKRSSKQKVENELRTIFNKVDTNNSGKVSAKELTVALLNFDNTKFQESTVSLMIKFFNSNNSRSRHLKSMNFEQFISLWKYLSAYKKLFISADTNKTGTITFGEFQCIIDQIGYKLNIDLVLYLFQKFSDKSDGSDGSVGRLKFDNFIELLISLRRLTDIFKKYDKDLAGVATINFLDFLYELLSLS